MGIINVPVTYEPVSAIPDYNAYTIQLSQLNQQLGLLGFVTERDTREKVIDPLFMGLGDYDVKSDGSPEGDPYHCTTYHLYHYKGDNGEYKWEDAFSTYPFLSIKVFQRLYGLSFSPILDLIIKNGSKRVIVESKKKGQLDHLKAPQYRSDGAIKLLNRWKEKKDEVDELSKFCDKHGKSDTNPKSDTNLNNHPYSIDDMPDVNMPDISVICVHWYDGNKSDLDPAYGDPNTDPAYDAGTEFTLTFKDGTEVKLYQSDWYLFDLRYAKADVRSAVSIDGEVARRFYKEVDQITPKDYNLSDPSQFEEFRADVQNDLA